MKAIINLRPASPGHEMGCALAVLPPLCGDLTRGGGRCCAQRRRRRRKLSGELRGCWFAI
jgi:hypothetical protein